MQDAGIIDDAVYFIEKLRGDVAKITFIKKSGELMYMKCTLDFNLIPKGDKPKSVNIQQILKLIRKNGIARVYDLEKKGWRSVPFNKTEYMELEKENKRYRIRAK